MEIVVAHVDHMFRGDESYEDLQFVQGLCEELGIICETIRINVSQYQQQYGMNAQVLCERMQICIFGKNNEEI